MIVDEGFLIGLRFDVGVVAGLRVFVGTNLGGTGKFCTSTEAADSVDLRFFDRVGAIVTYIWFRVPRIEVLWRENSSKIYQKR